MSDKQSAKGGIAPGANLPATKGDQSLVKQPAANGETMELKAIKENVPLTVEETIKKVEELKNNIDKRELLKDHYHAISSLKFGDFDEKDQIVLISHTGEKYPIRSSSMCQECAELLKHRIKEHIEDVEQRIVL
jgi:hypothetical protein